jgi:hypothetical protein
MISADRAKELKSYVRQRARQTAVLLPNAARNDAVRDDDWKLVINAEVEPEL